MMMRKFIVPFSALDNSYPNASATNAGQVVLPASTTADIANTVAVFNTRVANKYGSGTKNVINPEYFYSKQLLDTIRLDANEYSYYRYADEMPLQEKADKLTVRRWSPLQAHTVPLVEGVPPISDKGSVEKFEIQADSYGRFMEFTDKVDFAVVDPVVAHYSREYSIVAVETLDLLAQKALLTYANKKFAGGAANQGAMTWGCKPAIADLRLIGLSLKKQLVKPRSNGRFHVLVSPEFVYDMLEDEYVQNFMRINQTTAGLYDNATLVPMFGFEFYEVMNCPTTAVWTSISSGSTVYNYREYKEIATSASATSGYTKVMLDANGDVTTTAAEAVVAYEYKDKTLSSGAVNGGYVADKRTGQDASYIPARTDYEAAAAAAVSSGYKLFKFQHTIIIGKDALARTGLAGEGNAKMFVKPLGSAGVLDPIDQRQSIGFKINSVGFGTVRAEAIVDYINCPTQLNI